MLRPGAHILRPGPVLLDLDTYSWTWGPHSQTWSKFLNLFRPGAHILRLRPGANTFIPGAYFLRPGAHTLRPGTRIQNLSSSSGGQKSAYNAKHAKHKNNLFLCSLRGLTKVRQLHMCITPIGRSILIS